MQADVEFCSPLFVEVEYFLALSIDVVVASVVLLNKRRNIASIARIPQYSESLLRVSFFSLHN